MRINSISLTEKDFCMRTRSNTELNSENLRQIVKHGYGHDRYISYNGVGNCAFTGKMNF